MNATKCPACGGNSSHGHICAECAKMGTWPLKRDQFQPAPWRWKTEKDKRHLVDANGDPVICGDAFVAIPELLATLEAMTRLYRGQITNVGEYYSQLFDAAQAAIKKAKGETK